MMKETITLTELKEMGACRIAQKTFEEVFCEEVTIEKLLVEVRRQKQDEWEIWLLSQNTNLTEAMLHIGKNVHTNINHALRLVSMKGGTKMVRLLLEHGANVRAGDDDALRHASDRGRTEVVKLLLEHGANVRARNDCALQLASNKGHTEVKNILIEAMKMAA